MQLGIILRLLTVFAAFVLGRIAFDNPVFDEMLITLPAELVSYLFLFYWLHCYIREQIPKAGKYQLVKSACGSLLLLLLNLSGDVASALLSRVPRYFADIASLGYSLLLLAFVSSYVFYWTLKPAEEQGLRYPEFIRALFSFAKKKPGLLLAVPGAYALLLLLMIVILFFLLCIGVDIWSLIRTPPIAAVAALVLQFLTIFVPFTEAKLYTAFADFFIRSEENKASAAD